VESIKIEDGLRIPPGRHTLDPSQVGERQRERLLRAMATCVGNNGYADTTIADIVRVAHTSRSAFYEQFADKEACFLAAYEQMTAGFISASLQEAERVSSWQEKLDLGISTYFEWMAARPEVAVSTVVEVHSAGRRALEARNRALRDWVRTLEGVAVLARRSGAEVQLDGSAYLAIVLTAEAQVHDYALRGQVEHVAERAAEVVALARTLFDDASTTPPEIQERR
jgi:AcrR family transcriptional regulator